MADVPALVHEALDAIPAGRIGMISAGKAFEAEPMVGSDDSPSGKTSQFFFQRIPFLERRPFFFSGKITFVKQFQGAHFRGDFIEFRLKYFSLIHISSVAGG
jgi:hypothetical protein